ncbi:carbohydrate sulfotransferase 5-like [Penaeus japonicus]|uniref:carbohydrate sulfotransferase 5-like n=1 Tax=Penaeus japonicus TaxID=27405 RepID=UPI001C715D11|nr:carbohydrate sulfotransferase 5-like [Penaeus japonicus]
MKYRQALAAVALLTGMLLLHGMVQNHFKLVLPPTLSPERRRAALTPAPVSYEGAEEEQQRERQVAEMTRVDASDPFKIHLGGGGRGGFPRPPKAVVLWTGWRSGSTFVGQLLARATNATFYSYEPLHKYKVHVLHRDRNDTRAAVKLLRDVLRCRLLRHQDQVSYMAHQKWYLRENTFLNKYCKPSRACSSTAIVGKVCRMASLHVAKVLRLSLRWARPLLEDEDLDVQVIYMVRDPRAVLSSRARVSWCTSSTCGGHQTVCSLLEKDLNEAAALLQEYPNRFMFVQYEEMCQNMSAALADIMDFLGLPVTNAQKKMLNYEAPSTNSHTIAKNSFLQAQLWRNMTSYSDIVVPVQKYCRASLEKLSLRIFNSNAEFQNLSVQALIRPSMP